jgi:hypothetical protein
MNPNDPNDHSYNPFGIIQGMGQTGHEPFYSADGRYNARQQAWVSPLGLGINFNNTAYLQGGYADRYRDDPRYNLFPPAPQCFNDRQRAHMQEQIAHDGLSGAFDWRLQAMSGAEMQREWARCEAEIQEAERPEAAFLAGWQGR